MTPLHESETQVGRITMRGTYDRRYGKRCDHGGRECEHIYQQAIPKSHPDDVTLKEFAIALAVCLLWWGALLYALPILLIGMGWTS